jgi:hypothetical protein
METGDRWERPLIERGCRNPSGMLKNIPQGRGEAGRIHRVKPVEGHAIRQLLAP